MGKRIAIATIGTTGDIKPYLALAIALQENGHHVVFGSNADFKDLITSHGIEFYNLGSKIQAWMQQSRFENVISKSAMLNVPSILRDGQLVVERAARRAWRMSHGADAIIVQITTSFGIDIAEALEIPVIMTALQPLNPTREFPICAYQWPDLGPAFNRLSYIVTNIQQGYYDFPRDRLRKQLMKLKPRRSGGLFKDSHGNNLDILYNFSTEVSPRPADWGSNAVVTGYWPLPDNSGWTPSPEFREFLNAGSKPIYVGFGSMPFGAERNTRILREAMNMWGGRAVVARGWGGIDPADLPNSVFAIDQAPHDKLFEHVSAVVHHGGAGSTAAGLYAGKPTFVVPQTYDQPYWGRRIRELGCGPAPVPLSKLTSEKLANALEELTTNAAYSANAERLAQKLAAEDGVGFAVKFIEDTIAKHATSSAAMVDAKH